MADKAGKLSTKKAEKLSNKQYTKELRKLQARLCELQAWVRRKASG